MYHSMHTYAMYTCTSDLTTVGRNLIYSSILTYAFRQTYLYKRYEYTWQKLNGLFSFKQTYLYK
jgi:hypothetical protein